MLDARLEVSLTHFRRAFEAERRLRGPHHPHLAVSLNRMAMALEALGDLEGATFAASHAALLIERAGDRFEAALQYANLGVLAQNSNRWAEAMVYSRHAIDLYQTAGRTPDSRMSFPLRLMGLSLIQLGRPNLAIAPLERALLLHGTSRYDRNEIPKTRLALARALWESRGDRTRARRLALEAKAELLGSDRGETVEFQEVTEWLSSH